MKANVLVVGDGEQLCLYTRDGGHDLPRALRKALYRGYDNWSNPDYLAIVVFDEMKRKAIDGLTGYGISQNVRDGADRVITVDVRGQSVSIGGRSLTFQDYVNYNHGWEVVDAPKLSKYGQESLAVAAFPCCANDFENRFRCEIDNLYAKLSDEAVKIGWRLNSDGAAIPPDGQAFDEYKLPVYRSKYISNICAEEMSSGKRARFISKRGIGGKPLFATFSAAGGDEY